MFRFDGGMKDQILGLPTNSLYTTLQPGKLY